MDVNFIMLVTMRFIAYPLININQNWPITSRDNAYSLRRD
jgi:hypothetical protein